VVKLGVDLGGTKIEGVALDANGAELVRRRVPTPVDDYEATLDTVQRLVTEVERELGRRGAIGIGTPGAIDARSGLLKNSNSTVLNGQPLRRDLERRLDREIIMANDANCFALSEAIDGAGTDAGAVFGVILGTGVGGGIVIRRCVITGRNSIAGEWGHNALPWSMPHERPGPPCYCGKRGCIETFLSGPALAKDFAARTGRTMTAAEIATAAALNDADALAAITAYENRLARGLASVVNVLDPDVIVLGGGLSNIARLYDNVPRLMESYVFSKPVDLRIVPARHGDSSGVRGAAWLGSAG
jgi:fructokinase